MTVIVASAPCKVVVSGEYAVLVGAPALAMAINRRVICTLRDTTASGWRFHTHGYADEVSHPVDALIAAPTLMRTDPAHLCQHVLQQLLVAGIDIGTLPQNLNVAIDSRAGFDTGQKLGIGTSAAISAALTSALLTLCGSTLDPFGIAFAAHRAAQGGRGSGIDVAAACRGGLICYETDKPTPRMAYRRFPTPLLYAAIWTGAVADTREHITQFDTWRDGTIPPPLAALMTSATAVVAAMPDAAEFMRQLRAYTVTLRSLDDIAHLGIYSAAHRTLADLGNVCGVVYKPCGAGGGDLGMAFALDPDAVAAFVRAANAAGFKRLPLELDEHGTTVGIEG